MLYSNAPTLKQLKTIFVLHDLRDLKPEQILVWNSWMKWIHNFHNDFLSLVVGTKQGSAVFIPAAHPLSPVQITVCKQTGSH